LTGSVSIGFAMAEVEASEIGGTLYNRFRTRFVGRPLSWPSVF
jgi:hypothetical protein